MRWYRCKVGTYASVSLLRACLLVCFLGSGYSYDQVPNGTDYAYQRLVIHSQQQHSTKYVKIRLIPIKIQSLDERYEELRTTIRLQVTWVDPSLRWKLANGSTSDEIIFSYEQLPIWLPDIALFNDINDVYSLSKDRRFQFKVEPNGRVWWHLTSTVSTRCQMLLRLYPFDRQKCHLIFESPTYDQRYLKIEPRNRSIDFRMLINNGEWKIVGNETKSIVNQVTQNTAFSRIKFTLTISRNSLFYQINYILPSFLLSVLQTSSFLLPPSHVQRVGLTTVTLLSAFIIQTTVVHELPRTSESVSLLSMYIQILTCLSIFIVLSSIITARMVNPTVYTPVPSFLLRLVGLKPPAVSERSAALLNESSNDQAAAPASPTPSEQPTKNIPMAETTKLMQMHILKRKNINFDDVKQNTESYQKMWFKVTVIYDRIGFVFSSLTIIFLPIILFLSVPEVAEEEV